MSIDLSCKLTHRDDDDDDEETSQDVTVKFQITDTQIVAHVYNVKTTLKEIKMDMGEKFKIPSKCLKIIQHNIELPDEYTLSKLFRNDFEIIEVKLELKENAKNEKMVLDLNVYYNHFTLPEIITVRIPIDDNDDDVTKDVVVEIENRSIVKPFLGGFKDINTGIEYHDAFTQTGPSLEQIKFEGIYSRNTQTVELKTTSEDTSQDTSVQCYGQASELIYIPNHTDYQIRPRPYETSDQMIQRLQKLKKIKLIQKNFRIFLLKKLIKESAAKWRSLVAEQKRREERIEEIYMNRFKRECVVKAYPKTKQDFDLLYTQVQKWKEAEIKKINRMYSGGPKIAELNCLLDKEIQLLNGIEHQRNLLKKEINEERIQKLLLNMGEPKKWVGYKNQITEMDTLRTQRVRFFTFYYNKLKKPLNKFERLKLLAEVEKILNQENLPEASEKLEELFDRERKLLNCNFHPSDLEFLRQRQLNIFLEIVKDEKNYKEKKIETRMCKKCHQIRSLSDFAFDTRQSSIFFCKTCTSITAATVDKSIYRSLLRGIRRDEKKRKALSSVAFVIQENDIKYIVENIWHGHSILNESDDKSDLRLVRWKIEDDWAPWNCICLTSKEARAHLKVQTVHEIYQKELINSIETKNSIARSIFRKLREINFDFVESGEWWDVGLDGSAV